MRAVYFKDYELWRKNDGPYRYTFTRKKYYSPFRTMNERRENTFTMFDEDCVHYGIKFRGSRGEGALNPWTHDKPVGKDWGKSWKHFTRHRKQWMGNL